LTARSTAATVGGRERRSVSMLMTRYFVLLELPHAGGHLIRAACLEKMPREAFIPNDLRPGTPYEEIAADFADLPTFGVVRNPWDWYVAWYDTAMRAGVPAPNLWASAFESGRADFRTALVRALTGERFRSEPTENTMREEGVDHYSALYLRIVAGAKESGRAQVGCFERLAEDFGRFVAAREVPDAERLTTALRERLESRDKTGYRSQYDDDLRDLVGTKAKRLIDEYGYAF
jgi:hypothetical protein